MKFKAIWKDTFREIGKSKMRFLAILTIILLGVSFYVGISATGPDMVHTAEQYYQELNLMDYKVQSTYGLTAEDITSLEEINDLSVQSQYAYDFLLDDATAIRLYSYHPDKEQEMNQYSLIEGRLPNQTGEIAIDHIKYLRENIQLGDTIQLDAGENAGNPDDHLTTKQFKVVGSVNSPLFLEINARGISSVGSGTLSSFGVITKDNYTSDLYTEAYLKVAGSEKYPAYSTEYEQYTANYEADIENKLTELAERRKEEIIEKAQKKIDEGWADIAAARQELTDAENELKKARTELDEGWQDLDQGKNELKTETTQAQQKIAANEQKLQEGTAELARTKKELSQQKEALQNQLTELSQTEKDLQAGITQIESAIPQVEKGLKEIEQNLPALQTGIETVQKQRQVLEEQKKQIQQALENPDIDPTELNIQLTAVENGLRELAAKEQELTAQLTQLTAQRQELAGQLTGLNQQAQQLQQNKAELTAGKQQIQKGLADIEQGFTLIQEKENEIQAGYREITSAKNTLAEKTTAAQKELDQADVDLNEGETDYTEALATYETERADALIEIEEGEADLLEAESELSKLPNPDYKVFDRADNLGYSEYEDNAERLSVIAKVFPVFFFLIAIFISFTTMTRMVEEEREYIGIMKAMGYKNRYILIKFIVYAAIATIIGSLFGLMIGYTLFPTLIFYAYSSMYNFPEIILQQYPFYTGVALLSAFISTVGASLLAVRYSLRSNAARLLQPKPPKKGSRIWLERIGFIWNRLSFNYKITFRNVFRYKSRMLMTILGIAGSTGLILTGFGISDSIGDIPDIQYGDINKFQAYVALNPNASTETLEDYRLASQQIDGLDDAMFVLQQNVRAEKEGVNTQDMTFFIPENPERMEDFVRLSNSEHNDKIYELEDSGVYLTSKIAKLFDLQPGDSFEVLSAEDEIWTVNVAGIVENYMNHLAYMTPTYYAEVTGEEYKQPDIQLIKYDSEVVNTDQLGSQLLEKEAVAGIQYVDDVYDAFAGSLQSLDLITQILVISAAALAFIVLYNLTNINVSERSRELSTIKVLGSYDYEVTTYIYRENIILTLLGILAGLGFGKLLTDFIMETMEIDILVFGRNIYLSSYFYASLLTIVFTLVVMGVIHFQLKKIDMVEALKGND